MAIAQQLLIKLALSSAGGCSDVSGFMGGGSTLASHDEGVLTTELSFSLWVFLYGWCIEEEISRERSGSAAAIPASCE